MGFRHVNVCTNDYPYYCEWVFVMHISVQMTINYFWMGFRHVHDCTNDYPFILKGVFVMHISVPMTIHLFWKGISSCTCLYEWLSISFEWAFIMYMFVRMTINFLVNGFSSCTCFYKWLCISFEWVLVMYISVWMTTFSFWMDFLHIHLCTDDSLLNLNGFSSCPFLYAWLPFLFEWIVVIYISVRMTTISFWMDCCHALLQEYTRRRERSTLQSSGVSFNASWFRNLTAPSPGQR